MYRRNQLCGIAVLTFGIGMLIGLWVDSSFLAHCCGFGFVFCGCGMMRKK